MRVTLQTLEEGARSLGIKVPQSANMERLEDLINQHMIKLDPNFGRFACEGCSKDTSTEIASCPFCGSVFIPEVEETKDLTPDVVEKADPPPLLEPEDDPWADAWEDEEEDLIEDPVVSTNKGGNNRASAANGAGQKVFAAKPLNTSAEKADPVLPKKVTTKKKALNKPMEKAEATGLQTKPTTTKKKVSKKRKAKPISAALQRRENRKSRAANKIKREKKEEESKKKRAQLRKSLPFSVGDINKMKRVTLVMLAGVLGINNPIKLGKDDVIRQTIINAQQEKYGR